MKKFIILAAIAALAGGLQGCQTVPYGTGTFMSFQKYQASVYHLEIQSANLIKQLKQELQTKNISDMSKVSISVDLKNTPYNEIYTEKLQYAILKEGFKLSDSSSDIGIRVTSSTIKHEGSGYWDLNVFGSTADDTNWGELVITSKVFFNNKLSFIRSDNFYIPESHLSEYKYN